MSARASSTAVDAATGHGADAVVVRDLRRTSLKGVGLEVKQAMAAE